MDFFKLTHPEYSLETEATRRNPVRSVVRHRLPGMTCDRCGPWSSSDRLRVTVPASVLAEFEGVTFLPTQEWFARRDQWATKLGVPAELLSPGAEIGKPRGEVSGDLKEDFFHPMPGESWVVARVAECLQAAGLVGLQLAAVELTANREVHVVPELFAIVPAGRAWRLGSDEAALVLCELCGRRGFPRPKSLAVDQQRWDGSDFFIVDRNPNVILVTDRVHKLVTEAKFSNVNLIAVR